MQRERFNIGINPGAFRHTITLLEQVSDTDDSGVRVTYAAADPPVTAKASIEYIRATEAFRAGQEISQTYATITAWWDARFAATKRVQGPNGNQFVIQAVENVRELNFFMILTCQAAA
jgi:head-tail adaptor